MPTVKDLKRYLEVLPDETVIAYDIITLNEVGHATDHQEISEAVARKVLTRAFHMMTYDTSLSRSFLQRILNDVLNDPSIREEPLHVVYEDRTNRPVTIADLRSCYSPVEIGRIPIMGNTVEDAVRRGLNALNMRPTQQPTTPEFPEGDQPL